MQVRKITRRLGAAAVIVGLATALTGCDDPPTTVTATVDYECRIRTGGFIPDVTGETSVKYDTTAPQAVAPDGTLAVKVVPEPFFVDGTPTADGTVTQVSSLVWKVQIPANASIASHTIDGWSNVGAGTPTSSVSGNTVTITVPGPIASSAPANPSYAILPTLNLTLTATGPAGSRIVPSIAGTSVTSPGLTFVTRLTGTALGTINPAFSCFPGNRALHSTLVSTDTKAPKITITSPVADQTIKRYAVVKAGFTCDDGNGVGVASCVGTVANGANLNTSTLGTKTFTVTASDTEGKVSTATVSYTVVA